MNIDSTAFLVDVGVAIAKHVFPTVPVVQTLVDESVALGEPFEEIFILDIVNRNMEVVITAHDWSIVLELPVENRDDVRDIAIFQRLRTPEADESGKSLEAF